MASRTDKLLTRFNELGTKEIWAARVGEETITIAGADGKAEAERRTNEQERVASEAARESAEAARKGAEAERAAKDAERDAATKAANTAALSASSAAQSANANAANANTQANAAKAAAAQANAAARLTKPYFIQQSEPPYADRVDGGMWVETAGTAVRSVNRWDSAKQGAALYPSATTYPQASTFPAPTGEWSKFTV